MRIIKISLKYFLISIGILLLATTIFEQVSQLYFHQQKPPKEEFVDVNGREVHFVKKGNGSPTIVFQSGLGGDYQTWKPIQDSLAKLTTTVSYDRSGILWSADAKSPKSTHQITDELVQVLEKSKCPKPYILVGHSLAGLTLKDLVAHQEDQINAVVFIDVSHPEQLTGISKELRKFASAPPRWLLTLAVETGLFRIYFNCKPFVPALPLKHEFNQHVANYFFKIYEGMLDEAHADDEIFKTAAGMKNFNQIPLKVITASYPNGMEMLKAYPSLEKEYLNHHFNNQKDLLKLSSNSQQIFATKSDHYVPQEEPELVIETLKGLLAN